MNQIRQILQEWQQEYATHHPNGPKLVVKAKEKGKGEGFCVTYSGGTITLEAPNLLAAAYGINDIDIGVRSGHLADFLGDKRPRFPLRPLWLKNLGQLPEETALFSLCLL